MSIREAKDALDSLITKARVDLYKPIHVAEVLHRYRTVGDFDPNVVDTFMNPSLRWRNAVTMRLIGKVATSSARYQHDVWNNHAMPPHLLAELAAENNNGDGVVERYIYERFRERNASVISLFDYVRDTDRKSFDVGALLENLTADPGTRRSVDKVYEIVTYSLFETVVVNLGTKITVGIDQSKAELLVEFEDLAKVLLGIDSANPSAAFDGHLYRVGVTNAADRGLDMWANFGPAVQVKHLTMNPELMGSIVEQVESDRVVVVCQFAEARQIETLLNQLSWGARVAGVVTERDLIRWYDKALTGPFGAELGDELIFRVQQGIENEFQYVGSKLTDFFTERDYYSIRDVALWVL